MAATVAAAMPPPAGSVSPHRYFATARPGRKLSGGGASPPSLSASTSAIPAGDENGGGEGLKYLHLRPPPHLADRAARELGETDARRSVGLSRLVAAQHEAAAAAVAAARSAPGTRVGSARDASLPAVAQFRTALAADPVFLLAFLRVAKFRPAAAAARIDRFAALVEAEPWASLPSVPQLLRVYSHGALGLTDTHDRAGRRMVTVSGAKLVSLLDDAGMGALKQVGFWAFVALTRQPEVAICGVVLVQNMEGAGVGLLRHLRGPEMSAWWGLAQHVLPLRLRGIYITAAPSYMGLAWSVVRKFLSPKVRDRVMLLGKDPTALHKVVDLDHLPVEVGGRRQRDEAYAMSVVVGGLRDTKWMVLSHDAEAAMRKFCRGR